jgi:multidrug transporter EmrE-like cation transporter
MIRGAELALIFTGVLLNAGAQLLLKAGARTLGGLPLSIADAGVMLERALFNGPILAGLVCYVVSVGVWILALTRVDVSVAYPMLSVGYVVNALAAWALFSEQLSARRLAGIAVIVFGCWLVARS